MGHLFYSTSYETASICMASMVCYRWLERMWTELDALGSPDSIRTRIGMVQRSTRHIVKKCSKLSTIGNSVDGDGHLVKIGVAGPKPHEVELLTSVF